MANLHLQLQHNSDEKNIAAPLTPRDIVKKQITDFHYHVTEEDFDRMVVTDQLSENQANTTLQETEALLQPAIHTPYNMLDNQ